MILSRKDVFGMLAGTALIATGGGAVLNMLEASGASIDQERLEDRACDMTGKFNLTMNAVCHANVAYNGLRREQTALPMTLGAGAASGALVAGVAAAAVGLGLNARRQLRR